MSIFSLEQIVVNLPIYGSFSFKLFGENGANLPAPLSEDAKKQFYELFFKDKIDIKCVECDKEYPFNVEHIIKKEIYKNDIYKYLNVFGNHVDCSIDSRSLYDGCLIPPKTDEGIIKYVFRCTMNRYHYQTMSLLYTFNENVLTIRKIGQKPINIDLKETHSNEYKRILDNYDSFDDYRHYEQSASRNLLAGACTYLRRVLEKMILIKLSNSGKSKEEIGKLKHIEDKIEAVKDQFDDDVKDILTQSYGLLSQGIHELNNEEIADFYRSMLEVINIQLESEKEKMLRDERRKKLRSEINEAISKNKKK